MVLIDLTQQVTPWIMDVPAWFDPNQGLLWHLHIDWSLLAQQFDTDVFAGTRKILNNFVKSGQIWALLIGIVLGYIIRGLTSYG
jgi:hypothetical protein